MKVKVLKMIKKDFSESEFKHEGIEKVLLKDISLLIQCENSSNFEPMFTTDLYINKSGCYCCLLEYFYDWKKTNEYGFKILADSL